MAYPENVTTRQIVLPGTSILESSNPVCVRLTVKSTRSLVNAATGFRLESVQFRVVSEPGDSVVHDLPVTDQQGWKDSVSGSLIDVSVDGSFSHEYVAVGEFFSPVGISLGVPGFRIGPFVLPVGDGSVFNLETALVAGTVEGGQVSVPDSWSASVLAAQVAAESAAISAADAVSVAGDALPIAEVDTTVAGYIDSASATRTALTGAIGTSFGALFPESFGAIGDGTADDTAAINAALASAPTSGVGVYLGGVYKISDGLSIAGNHTLVWGRGFGVQIIQTVWPKPAFDVQDYSDVTIRDISGHSLPDRIWDGFMTQERGNWGKNMSSFVVSHGDRTSVIRCGAKNFEIGVNLINWDYSAQARGDRMVGCIVNDFRVEDCLVGVFSTGFKGLAVSSVTGSYMAAVDKPNNGGHLCYIGDSTETVWNEDLTLSNCHATYGRNNSAYQVKKVKGFVISGITSDNCDAILRGTDLSDGTIAGLVSTNDVSASDMASLAFDGVQRRVKVTSPIIELLGTATSPAINTTDGEDCAITDATVSVTRQVTGTTEQWEIDIRGQWDVIRPTITNTGIKAWNGVRLSIGSGASVMDPRVSGARVSVAAGNATNARFEVDASRIAPHSTDGQHKLQNLSATSRFVTDRNRHLHDTANVCVSTFETAASSIGYLLGSEYGPAWVSPAAVWLVSPDGYTYNPTLSSSGIVTVDTGLTDMTIDVQMKWRHGAGVMLRYVDASTRLWVRIQEPGTVELIKIEAGVYPVLASAPIELMEYDLTDIKIDQRAGRIRVWVNALLVITHTLSTGDQETFGSSRLAGMVSSSKFEQAGNEFRRFTVRK